MNSFISRRYFIRASIALAMSQLMYGCGESNMYSKILFLENSIPLQLIRDFRQAANTEYKIEFEAKAQLAQIFDSLFSLLSTEESNEKGESLLDKIFDKSLVYPGLTTLGDAWLALAIEQNLIQPLSVKNLANWQKLPPIWQEIARRDKRGRLSAQGEVWGAPYRWGSTVIAYQSKKLDDLGIKIEDWQDLWQPELRDRVSLLDSPRETIGLTLKKLGHSYNIDNLESVANLESELLALHKQAKVYSSNHYLEPLILEDTWVAVGWSTDIIPLLKRYRDLKFIVPSSGTSLWADMWVKPKMPSNSDNDSRNKIIAEWIDFCWQPKAANQISLFTAGISPILSLLKPTELPSDFKDNPLLNAELFQSKQNEFLLPLTPETEKQYRDLWLKIRQG